MILFLKLNILCIEIKITTQFLGVHFTIFMHCDSSAFPGTVLLSSKNSQRIQSASLYKHRFRKQIIRLLYLKQVVNKVLQCVHSIAFQPRTKGRWRQYLVKAFHFRTLLVFNYLPQNKSTQPSSQRMEFRKGFTTESPRQIMKFLLFLANKTCTILLKTILKICLILHNSTDLLLYLFDCNLTNKSMIICGFDMSLEFHVEK